MPSSLVPAEIVLLAAKVVAQAIKRRRRLCHHRQELELDALEAVEEGLDAPTLVRAMSRAVWAAVRRRGYLEASCELFRQPTGNQHGRVRPGAAPVARGVRIPRDVGALDVKIRALYPTHGVAAIAAQLKRGDKLIRARIDALGLPPPTRSAAQQKRAQRELAAGVRTVCGRLLPPRG